MSVVDSIKEDHRRVERLFERFDKSHDVDIAIQICNELTAHAILEEEMLYPLLRNRVDEEMAEDSQDDHDDAKELIARILQMEYDDPRLLEYMKELQEEITGHVKEEETEVLPKMERTVGRELGEIEAAFMERKRVLSTAIVENETIVDLVEEENRQPTRHI